MEWTHSVNHSTPAASADRAAAAAHSGTAGTVIVATGRRRPAAAVRPRRDAAAGSAGIDRGRAAEVPLLRTSGPLGDLVGRDHRARRICRGSVADFSSARCRCRSDWPGRLPGIGKLPRPPQPLHENPDVLGHVGGEEPGRHLERVVPGLAVTGPRGRPGRRRAARRRSPVPIDLVGAADVPELAPHQQRTGAGEPAPGRRVRLPRRRTAPSGRCSRCPRRPPATARATRRRREQRAGGEQGTGVAVGWRGGRHDRQDAVGGECWWS